MKVEKGALTSLAFDLGSEVLDHLIASCCATEGHDCDLRCLDSG